MRKAFCALAMVLLLAGCAPLRKTVITMPNGKKYVITSRKDALVQYSDGKKKVTVDNRGRPTALEQIFDAALLRASADRPLRK